MSAASEAFPQQKPSAYRAILLGGLIAGTLDITAAFIQSAFYGRSPIALLQVIASGLLGADSYNGGLASAALGLALHFLIAYVATIVFYAASRKLTFMTQRPIICGVLYGVLVYLFMNYIVLPITFPGRITHQISAVAIGMTIIIFCIGLPISLIVRRYSARSLTLSLLALFIIISCGASAADASGQRKEAAAATPVVLVELFTSEGCSSCPPADRLLADLDEAQPVKGAQIIALSEHVDYWNRLGWKDPFSSAEFSQRQTEYAQALGAKDVYTPQMIVDGQAEFVGSKRETAVEAITKAARAAKADVSISIKSSEPKSVTLALRIENVTNIAAGDTADVMLAITENGLSSNVSRGENSGRKLAHSAVARRLVKVGAIKENSFSGERSIELESKWNRQNMKAVAFVQERSSRRVLGAAAIKLAGGL